ncbi:MAG: proprotein convertase P-domain-containing protein [Phycisphaerales bacterium]|nr:MAG: proprotein convertase P-domain-containing protein [Phycisphaerales bacterium]
MSSEWKDARLTVPTLVLSVAMVFAVPAPEAAGVPLPPGPANDTIAAAEVIGPHLPAMVCGTTVLADDTITSVPALPDISSYVDGPDVFYSFTPESADTYRVQLIPWQRAPLRSADRQFTIYVFEAASMEFLAGARAPGSACPVHIDAGLDPGVEYIIGVDHDDATYDNFPFTLIVGPLPAAGPDDCDTAEELPSVLPAVALNDIDGAANDFTFTQGTGRCAVAGTTPTTAPGIDHVYRFVPPARGDYAIELVSSGFDGVLYVLDACPGVFPYSCVGASNHSSSTTAAAKHELVVVTLRPRKEYYIFVDNGSTTCTTGSYTLIVADASTYEITEIEPNDSPATATPMTLPLNGGQLVGPADHDWYAITGYTADRIYAYVNNGGSSNSTLDTELLFWAPDGTTLLEYDDDDGDGINSPFNDLRYIYSTTSSVIAGARMIEDATHYLQILDDDDAPYSSNTRTLHRYRFHVGRIPGAWSPLAECEPNDTVSAADFTGKHYYAGVIDTADDRDFYAFAAEAGDRVFIALDGDPERDSSGSVSANLDPDAFGGKLVVYDPDGAVLLSDVSDWNSAQTGGGDYPAQGAFFVARTAGTHHVEVNPQSSTAQVGPTETYELAVFLNDAAPDLAEAADPVITLTPDFADDVVWLLATDDQVGDSGICSIDLVDNLNLQVVGTFTPGDPVVNNLSIEPVDTSASGIAKLVVSDCAGNTVGTRVKIDVDGPVCEGLNVSTRSRQSLHGPIHVPDNQPLGPGIDGIIEITEPGIITDVNVTVSIETIRPPDIDVFLESPAGTLVELVTDGGSSLAFDITDATFDDDACEIMSILTEDAPYTGTWLPEDPAGLAQLNGEDAQGVWKLNVRDDSPYANGGARLARWRLDVAASFGGPESFVGTATDLGPGGGIQSIVLSEGVNTQLNLPADFTPGDQEVVHTVTLIDTAADGSGTVTVTDTSENTCHSAISLSGLPDNTAPANSGWVTTDLTFHKEVQSEVPQSDPSGVVSSIAVPDSILVGQVEVDLTIDTENVGRLASTLSHNGEVASLVNRVGMEQRADAGLTKDNIEITLDDDAPQADDAHMEPALGSIEFVGLHQPGGRAEFIGDGVTGDNRDNMLFTLAGLDSAGDWDLMVGDFRAFGSNTSVFRRWAMTIQSPCGPDRYVGTAMDPAPGAGICSIGLTDGAANVTVVTDLTPGDEIVDYRVELIDASMSGWGILEITDCSGNVVSVPVDLTSADADVSLPTVDGNLDVAAAQFVGLATDDRSGDTGIVSVELAPFSHNLQFVSVSPDPPDGAAGVGFVVGLIDPAANGRGYVRVTDTCGWRSHVRVEIDALPPICTGSVGNRIRYFSGDLSVPIPDGDAAGITSNIPVTETDQVSDVDVTVNITHAFDDDIDLMLISPAAVTAFTDIGSLGNDFIDTTLDDEAAGPMPDTSSAAPFTGAFQPEDGPALYVLDGVPASGTYTLSVTDDKIDDTGTLDSWSLLIESPTFPQAFDGRAEDGRTHDLGVCSVELLDGAVNTVLTIDPAFTPGDAIVRYQVELDNPECDGEGMVRVTGCSGNVADEFVQLASASPPTQTNMDIKPGFCPNSFNCQSHGVLPIALLGTADFDVTTVDPASVRLSRADGLGGSAAVHEGPLGPRSTIEDAGTPFAGPYCACHELNGDGFDDLSLNFRVDDLVAALELGGLPPGLIVELAVTGRQGDGCRFVATDCVRLVPPSTPPGLVAVESTASEAWIWATPLDRQLDGGGFANFERSYPTTTMVTLNASPLVDGRAFFRWEADGQPQPIGVTTLDLEIGGPSTAVRAIYYSPVGQEIEPGQAEQIDIKPIGGTMHPPRR